jgi:hypothetical protein
MVCTSFLVTKISHVTVINDKTLNDFLKMKSVSLNKQKNQLELGLCACIAIFYSTRHSFDAKLYAYFFHLIINTILITRAA